MKKEMTSFDVAAVALELDALNGAWFDKAYQTTSEIILRMRGQGKKDIVIQPGKAIFFSATDREMPTEPSRFAATIRSHLSGSRLSGASQRGFDRVIELSFTKGDDRYRVVAELFRDGNVVLVKGDIIIQPLSTRSWAAREIRSGEKYEFPPPRFNLLTAKREEIMIRLDASKHDVVRAAALDLNLGGLYGEEICKRAGITKGMAVSELSPEERSRFVDALLEILSRLKTSDLSPHTYHKDGRIVEVAPLDLMVHAQFEKEPVTSLSAALEKIFEPKPELDPRELELKAEKERLERQIRITEESVLGFKREGVEARESGDLFFANYELVEALLKRLKQGTRDVGWREYEAVLAKQREDGDALATQIGALDGSTGSAFLLLPDPSGRSVKVKVDVSKTLAENSQDYYAKAKTMKEKEAGAQVPLSEAKAALSKLEKQGIKLADSIARKKGRPKPTKKLWFDTYKWFVSSDGNLVLAGRDAGSNEKLVKKHLVEGDRYAHADVQGASSVVVKRKDGEDSVPEPTLAEACRFAAINSKAWAQRVGSTDAYWVTPEQVSKTPAPGEYVGRGAFIIRGKRNYVQCPMKCAIGEVEVEGTRKVMGGPVSAVAFRSTKYVVMEPGEENLGKLASELGDVFNVPVEEVQAALPPGPVRIVERVGLERGADDENDKRGEADDEGHEDGEDERAARRGDDGKRKGGDGHVGIDPGADE
ncbi:MAG: NFACT family protein [Euryarchaeota archaeon]|nr:NFACT family protein [Euryarchaeota archaeon]